MKVRTFLGMLVALLSLLVTPLSARAEGEFASADPGAALSALMQEGSGGGTPTGAGTQEQTAKTEDSELEPESTETAEGVGDTPPDDIQAILDELATLEADDTRTGEEPPAALDGFESLGKNLAAELRDLGKELGADVPEHVTLALEHSQKRADAVAEAKQLIRDGQMTTEQAKYALGLLDREQAVEMREAKARAAEVATLQERIKTQFPGADSVVLGRMIAAGATPKEVTAEAKRLHEQSAALTKTAIEKYLKLKAKRGEVVGGIRATGGEAGEFKAQDLAGLGYEELFSRM